MITRKHLIMNKWAFALAVSVAATPLVANAQNPGNPKFGSVVVGNPTGGYMGAGTLNATGLYINGSAVGGGGGVPYPGAGVPVSTGSAWSSSLGANGSSGTLLETDGNGGSLSGLTVGQVSGAQGALTLTTTGGSGAATLIGSTLNIPIYAGGGGGSVTTLSVVSANGFIGTVANPTSTPAITLTTSSSGVLKGSSGAIVPATAGTDYVTPSGSSAGLSQATTSAFGVVKPDGTTITISAGVISATGGGGSLSVTDGTHTVAGTTSLTLAGAGVISGTSPNATLTLGTAAGKASSASGATVASVSGTITAGHVATFADTAGTVQDGGALSTVTLTANQVLGSLNGTTTVGLTVPACTSGLNYSSGTGFSCGSGAGVSSFTGDGTLLNNSASTGAVTATLVNAPANSVLGNNTGSAAAPAYQTSIALSGTIAATGSLITSASANAATVGPNGTTNPAWNIDASTASSVTGLALKSAVAGGTTTLSLTDTSANSSLKINALGTGQMILGTSGGGTINMQTSSATRFSVSANQVIGSPNSITNAGTGLNFPHLQFVAASSGHATGTVALQTEYQFQGSTETFVAASTMTQAATVEATYKDAGTNATIVTSSGFYIPTAAFAGTVTNGYGIDAAAPTGATNNFAARIAGDVLWAGGIPTASTGTITTGSTDQKGSVTGLSAATALTITFAGKLGAAPACSILGSAAMTSPVITSISTSAVVFGFTAYTGTAYYHCF